MKTILFSSMIIFCFISCNQKQEETISATEYNNQIIGEQTKIMNSMLTFIDAIQTNNDAKIDETRRNITSSCELSLTYLKKMEVFDENFKFRDDAINLITFYKDISEKEYFEMQQILGKGLNIVQADIEKMNAIDKRVGEKETRLDDEFQKTQQEFAKKYNVTIVNNEMQKKIDNI